MLLCRLQSVLIVSLILSGTAGARNVISKPAAMMFMQGTPGFSVNPVGPVNLGPSAVGVETSHGFPVPIKVTNVGTADLTITPSFTSDDFGFTAESFFNFVVTLSPGQTKEGDILFLPHAAGPRTAQFVSTDNAPGSPHMVQITGTGVNVPANDFAVILDPAVSLVGVSPGKTTTFTAWVLAGPGLGLGPQGNIGCSGGPSGTACTLDHDSFRIDSLPFDDSRDTFVVSVTIPARSSSLLQRPAIFWASIPAVFAVLLSAGRRSRRAKHSLLISALLLGLTFVISCGGSSSPMNNGPLQLTATRNGVTHTLSVPLNQQ
jgi:hypothetical protein